LHAQTRHIRRCYRAPVSGPYRDVEMFECPACGQELRAYLTRLCCDACTGIFIAHDDLTSALDEHARGDAQVGFLDGPVGTRACPRCREPMLTCLLDPTFGLGHALPAPELDRCAKHGVWFDIGELAKVLEAARHATEPPSRSTLVEIARTVVEMWDYRRGAR
jgi:Zn-finger nucleic acid-binding protein